MKRQLKPHARRTFFTALLFITLTTLTIPTEVNAVSLHDAAGAGNVEEIQSLLAGKGLKGWILGKADPVKVDDVGSTALHYAAARRHFEAVTILLKADLRPLFMQDDAGCTPLHYAAFHGCDEVVDLLIRYSQKPLPIQFSADGSTPLHYAADHNRVDTIVLLANANRNLLVTRDNRGRIPLHRAALKNAVGAAKLLLKTAPTTLDIPDSDGNTPLHLTASNGSLAMAEFLANNGADPFLRNKNGLTPWQLAFDKGRDAVGDTLFYYAMWWLPEYRKKR